MSKTATPWPQGQCAIGMAAGGDEGRGSAQDPLASLPTGPAPTGSCKHWADVDRDPAERGYVIGEGGLQALDDREGHHDREVRIYRGLQIGMNLVPEPPRPSLMEIMDARDVQGSMRDLGENVWLDPVKHPQTEKPAAVVVVVMTVSVVVVMVVAVVLAFVRSFWSPLVTEPMVPQV